MSIKLRISASSFGVAKDLGCNFVRLAHYPHNEEMMRLANEARRQAPTRLISAALHNVNKQRARNV